jgi:hypothetical protein
MPSIAPAPCAVRPTGRGSGVIGPGSAGALEEVRDPLGALVGIIELEAQLGDETQRETAAELAAQGPCRMLETLLGALALGLSTETREEHPRVSQIGGDAHLREGDELEARIGELGLDDRRDLLENLAGDSLLSLGGHQ